MSVEATLFSLSKTLLSINERWHIFYQESKAISPHIEAEETFPVQYVTPGAPFTLCIIAIRPSFSPKGTLLFNEGFYLLYNVYCDTLF